MWCGRRAFVEGIRGSGKGTGRSARGGTGASGTEWMCSTCGSGSVADAKTDLAHHTVIFGQAAHERLAKNAIHLVSIIVYVAK